MEDGTDDVEPFRLVGPDHNGDHLAVEVSGGIVGGNQGLELLEPFLVVTELSCGRPDVPEGADWKGPSLAG